VSRILIVNADDFGMCEGVNRGILEAHRDGIVTSTTVMANMPAAGPGLATARERAPELGLGLHVNLTYGRPVLPAERVPTLVDSEGRFLDTAVGVGVPGRWTRRDLEAEIRAQLDRFAELAGRPPDHIDAHQLVSTLSLPVRDVVLELAERYGIAVRRGRTGWYAPMERLLPQATDLPSSLGPLLDRVPRPWRLGPMAERTPLSTDGLDLRFHGERATADLLLHILATIPDGVTELVCHPGYAGGQADDYAHREQELEALTDRRVASMVEQLGIRLVDFGWLRRHAQDG
jgi:predicted glycoside hydrolase/deacetylase ChbG (UPF0249 family)